jgi:hypothetical protein
MTKWTVGGENIDHLVRMVFPTLLMVYEVVKPCPDVRRMALM